MIKIYRNLTKSQTNLCIIILEASGIEMVYERNSSGLWDVFVEKGCYRSSLGAVQKYYLENRTVPIREEKIPDIAGIDIISALAGAVFIAICHLAVQMTGLQSMALELFGASSYRIMHGELYRAACALFIHGGPVHLAGNITAISLLFPVISSYTGVGVSWILILVSGISGNLMNAAFYRFAHLSIGFSTAVFGAVGILAALRFVIRKKMGIPFGKTWIHLAGGVCILAIFGGAGEERVDIMAHFFGLVCGLVTGALYALNVSEKPERKIQLACFAAVFSVILLSCLSPYIKNFTWAP